MAHVKEKERDAYVRLLDCEVVSADEQPSYALAFRICRMTQPAKRKSPKLAAAPLLMSAHLGETPEAKRESRKSKELRRRYTN